MTNHTGTTSQNIPKLQKGFLTWWYLNLFFFPLDYALSYIIMHFLAIWRSLQGGDAVLNGHAPRQETNHLVHNGKITSGLHPNWPGENRPRDPRQKLGEGYGRIWKKWRKIMKHPTSAWKLDESYHIISHQEPLKQSHFVPFGLCRPKHWCSNSMYTRILPRKLTSSSNYSGEKTWTSSFPIINSPSKRS